MNSVIYQYYQFKNSIFLTGKLINSLNFKYYIKIYQPFLILFIILCSYSLKATTYYVSSSTGNDSNNGTSEAHAWKTLTKVNSFTPKPGDQILFKRGDTWIGGIIVKGFGTASSPVTYGAYGTGANPVISGFASVTAWTNLGGNIWESVNAVTSDTIINIVTINGVNTPMGREPNAGYYFFQSNNGSNQITSNNLTGTPNWTGAELALNPSQWETKRCPIIAQSGGTLTFTRPETFTFRGNYNFIIQNDIRTLDQQNEWFFSKSTKKIRIFSTTQPTGVRVSTVSDLMLVENRNNITIRNIAFEGSNRKAMWVSTANNLTVDNCSFSNIGQNGIYGGHFTSMRTNVSSSNYLTVSNCSFSNINDNAIGIINSFTNATIKNNIIANTGMIYGANRTRVASTNSTGALVAINAPGYGSVIEHNKISDTGYIGIAFKSGNTMVRYNHIVDFCKVNKDGGGIYTWNYDPPFPNVISRSGIEVHNNIVSGGTTEKGIYIDDAANGVSVYNNVVFGCAIGIYLHNNYNVNVRGNTFFDNSIGLHMVNNLVDVPFNNVNFKSNKVIAKSLSQNVIDGDYMERIISHLVSDSNYLSRPIDESKITNFIIRNPAYSRPRYSLSGWQSYSGKDINSKTSPVSIKSVNDIQLLYNNTKQARTYNLGNATFKDIEGNSVSGSFTLESFTAIILIGKNFEKINLKPSISEQSYHLKSPKFKNDKVGQVFAYDPDTSQVLSYFIYNTDEKGWFSIDSTNGKLYVQNNFSTIKNLTIELQVLVKDNSVNSLSDSAAITIFIEGTDSSPPEITSFSVPSKITSFYIPVNSFSAIDNWGIKGYLITETPEIPKVNDTNWKTAFPSLYRSPGEGQVILYAWALDSANWITGPVSATVNVTFPDTSLIYSEYLFEEISGLKITDSNSSFDGEIIGEIERSTGVLSSGLNFTGTGYVNLGKSYSENVKDQITLSTWIKPGITNSDLPVITHGGPFNNTFELYLNAGSASIAFITNGTSASHLVIQNVNELWDGKWHHLAVTYNGNEKIIYLDNKIISKTKATGNIIPGYWNNLYLGTKIIQNDTLYFKGNMDEVRIYNFALDATSISKLFHSINKILNKVTSLEFISICEGEDYLGLTEPGKYSRILERKLTSASGADSIIITNLLVYPSYNLMKDVEICEGDTFLFDSKKLFESGEYTETFKSIQGCDSIVLLNLTVNPVYHTTKDIAITAGSNYMGWTNKGTYYQKLISVNGCDSLVVTNLTVIEPYIQIINLEKGWNIFSSHLIPLQPDFDDVFGNLNMQGQLIKVLDENGKTYFAEGKVWINNIGLMQESEGYKIMLNSSAELEIKGQPVRLPFSIPLRAGWNIISFPYNRNLDAMEVMDPLRKEGILEKVQDERGHSIEYWDSKIGWFNGIGNFNPGEGYWVLVNRQSVLPFSGEYGKSGLIKTDVAENEHYMPIFEGNGYSHMNINISGLTGMNLQAGDEIAAYDGEHCVGAVKLTETNSVQNIASINASASYKEISKGFTEGNKITLRTWQKSTNKEFLLLTNAIKGEMKYQKQGSVFAQLVKKNSLEPDTNISLTFSIYPNPANDLLTIKFSLPLETDSKIILTDMVGNQKIVRNAESSIELLDVSALPPGTYLLKLATGTDNYFNKLIKL